MEERIPCKQVKVSDRFYESFEQIYDFGFETFGYFQAERYRQKIRMALDTLPDRYLSYPECRHIPTKSRMYRNIIFDAHLIVYRITGIRIEVLDIIHAASSIGKIRNVRKIHL
ncbi:MAG: type II toxin-antitoxin system RelE/ParE family toxin [Bacteroidales bacterium]|nr:type II toxin-antitoxin system RelE/ParE family toxin [Bacteroidales bacterium]